VSDDNEQAAAFEFLDGLADPLPPRYWDELIERIHRRELGLELAESTSLEIRIGIPVFVETLQALLWALAIPEPPHE